MFSLVPRNFLVGIPGWDVLKHYITSLGTHNSLSEPEFTSLIYLTNDEVHSMSHTMFTRSTTREARPRVVQLHVCPPEACSENLTNALSVLKKTLKKFFKNSSLNFLCRSEFTQHIESIWSNKREPSSERWKLLSCDLFRQGSNRFKFLKRIRTFKLHWIFWFARF